MLDLGIYIIISALVGAKLLLLVTDFKSFTADPRELLTLARSGGVFYGGLILAVIVALWYIRRVGLPLWTTCDVFAPGIALGHVVGRFGCLFAGCCYGKPTTCRGGSRSPIRLPPPTSARRWASPLHPTQLYEAGAELLILIVLLVTERKGRPFPGRTFWLYMLLYAISRFIIEFYPRRRARDGRHVLDVAVHLDRAGAAGDRDARVSVARRRRPSQRGARKAA